MQDIYREGLFLKHGSEKVLWEKSRKIFPFGIPHWTLAALRVDMAPLEYHAAKAGILGLVRAAQDQLPGGRYYLGEKLDFLNFFKTSNVKNYYLQASSGAPIGLVEFALNRSIS